MSLKCPECSPAPAGLVLPAGTIKRIHVNQHIIRANVKQKLDSPAVTVQWRGKSYTGRDVVIRGNSALMQRMDKPLSCGARIWLETSAEVEIL
jgi:hypothetical protein